MRRLLPGVVAVLLGVLAGCQRLNYAKEATLDVKTDPLVFTIDGPSSEMKVNVKVSSDKPVNVWVILEDDKDSVLREVPIKKPAKALGGQEDTREADFEATIPAKNNFVVLISLAKPTTRDTAKVTLNVKSK